MKKIYLAGPEVFLPDAKQLGKSKKELCNKYGFLGLFPLDNEVDPLNPNIDQIIYKANVKMIRDADYGIFNLTPFRGISADVGTVFELGMLNGLGKPCFGYTTSNNDLYERMVNNNFLKHGETVDHNGWLVEDFGNHDNLMIDASLREGFNQFFSTDSPIDDLGPFEECLRHIRELNIGQ